MMIVPIVCYGCELWGFQKDGDRECGMNCLKYAVHLPPNAAATAVRSVGQTPINLYWKERIILYWNRVCSEDIPILLKHAALEQMQLYENNNAG